MRYIVTALIGIALTLFAWAAQAHWPAKYTGADYENCCDWDDCSYIEIRQYRKVPGGYRVAIAGVSDFVPGRAVYPSEEPRAVFCQAYRGNECLFLPIVG